MARPEKRSDKWSSSLVSLLSQVEVRIVKECLEHCNHSNPWQYSSRQPNCWMLSNKLTSDGMTLEGLLKKYKKTWWMDPSPSEVKKTSSILNSASEVWCEAVNHRVLGTIKAFVCLHTGSTSQEPWFTDRPWKWMGGLEANTLEISQGSYLPEQLGDLSESSEGLLWEIFDDVDQKLVRQ